MQNTSNPLCFIGEKGETSGAVKKRHSKILTRKIKGSKNSNKDESKRHLTAELSDCSSSFSWQESMLTDNEDESYSTGAVKKRHSKLFTQKNKVSKNSNKVESKRHLTAELSDCSSSCSWQESMLTDNEDESYSTGAVKKRQSKLLAQKNKGSKNFKVKSKRQSTAELSDCSSSCSSQEVVSTDSEDESCNSDPTQEKYAPNIYLKGKVGEDINAKMWLEECSNLDNVEKAEVVIRLIYEIFLAKRKCDQKNDSVEIEQKTKGCIEFDAQITFELIKNINRVLLPQDRKKMAEFVCQSDNPDVLEMICRQEANDAGGTGKISRQYPWKGEFTGYKTPIDLLLYALKQQCSSETVLCIAKKIYGNAHVVCLGEQYFHDFQDERIKRHFHYQDSVVKTCLKVAIELGYQDVASVMLAGDVYHCIRLMQDRIFQNEKRFREALDVIEETVAEIISSWAKQSCKDEVKYLLVNGIDIDVDGLKIKDLSIELENRGIELSRDDKRSKEILIKKLKTDKKGARLRLEKNVVGALILALFFNHQNALMELINSKKPFELKISLQDKGNREKLMYELNKRINNKTYLQNTVLKKIKLLNSSSHLSNNWFFREVLEKVVNEKLDKLQAVCSAICKEGIEELLKDIKVDEEMMTVLKFFDVSYKKSFSKIKIVVNEASQIKGNMENLVIGIKRMNDASLMIDEILRIVRGLASSKTPTFSGVSRRTIIYLKNKRSKEDLTDNEAVDLERHVFKVMQMIKLQIKALGDGRDI